MSFFSRKKDPAVTAVAVATAGATAVKKARTIDRDLTSVIVGPRLSEKAVNLQSDRNVYTFLVRRDATKFSVRDAIKALYGVTPVQVNIVNKLPAKRLSGSKNRLVKVPGEKKAYVYLKKGDTINLV